MINKISFPKPVAPSRAEAKKRTSSVDGSSFSTLLDSLSETEGATPSEPVVHAAPVLGAGALLGLQEVSEEEVSRKRAVRKGKSMLDALDSLRDALLVGSLSASTIRQLEMVIAEKRSTVMDPKLESILKDIEVRAAVELAKLESAGAHTSCEDVP